MKKLTQEICQEMVEKEREEVFKLLKEFDDKLTKDDIKPCYMAIGFKVEKLGIHILAEVKAGCKLSDFKQLKEKED